MGGRGRRRYQGGFSVRSAQGAGERPWGDGLHMEQCRRGQLWVGGGKGGGAVCPRKDLAMRPGTSRWCTGQEGNTGLPERVGVRGVTQTGERRDRVKSTKMATTMWTTLRADGLKPSLSSGKDVSTFPTMPYDQDRRWQNRS